MPSTSVPSRSTYNIPGGYEVDTFAPVVNYGSLSTLKSAYMASLRDCSSGFASDDLALHAYCNMQDRFGSQRSYLALETGQRETFSPIAFHRDRLCSSSWEISVEDTLARPPQHMDALFDTPERNKFMIDNWIVPAWARGEEQIDGRTLMLSMRSFVYVTSSDDPSVRPGMHRLIDLPVFGDVRCNFLPAANCAPPGMLQYINTGSNYLASFELQPRTTGRQLMRRVRVSQIVQSFTGQLPDRAPYASSGAGCYTGDLVLVSRPVLYSSKQWMSSLTTPPPSPPPLSPSPPPPNPLPPFPHPPPLAPYVQPQTGLMETIRGFEEQACTSVYYLTTATRCERLAVELAKSVLYEPLYPPSPPPAEPTVESPPPPSVPPSPSMPNGISETPVANVYLSTLRTPTEFYDDLSYVPENVNAAYEALRTAEQGQIARCTSWQTSAVLPCSTSAFATNCISGMRHCGTDAENSRHPLSNCGFPAHRVFVTTVCGALRSSCHRTMN